MSGRGIPKKKGRKEYKGEKTARYSGKGTEIIDDMGQQVYVTHVVMERTLVHADGELYGELDEEREVDEGERDEGGARGGTGRGEGGTRGGWTARGGGTSPGGGSTGLGKGIEWELEEGTTAWAEVTGGRDGNNKRKLWNTLRPP
jgi:hypothetical protein